MIKTSCFFAGLVLATFTIPSSGQAADTAGKFLVRGVGASKCSQLVSAIDSKDTNVRKDAVLLYTSWLNGYLSHQNKSDKDTYDSVPLTDSAHLLAVIVGQCRTKQNALVENISGQVIGLLSKAKISSEAPQVVLSVGSEKGNFNKATLIALQEKMLSKGLFKGKADGEFGADSQKALRAFQKTEGLKETGFPDTDTLMRALLK